LLARIDDFARQFFDIDVRLDTTWRTLTTSSPVLMWVSGMGLASGLS
jgi:hypothetical protein